MNIELKPIAESKVRQLGGDVCGVLVRKDEKLAAVDEHGRVTWLGDQAARAQSGQEVGVVKPSDPLPCPFCGSTDVGGAGGTVGCYRCPAEIAVQNANTAYAVELWNNRVKPHPQPAQLDPDLQLIRERDYWEGKATELAEDVGKLLGVEVGEHSSANCPVQNAIDAVFCATEYPAQQGIVPELIATDDDVERVAKMAGWDNRKYMTPRDYSEWCRRMRDFVRLSTPPQPQGDGWVKCKEQMPKLGQRVELFSQGVIQHMMPLLDEDDEGPFWDFEVHDYNPPVDVARDQWRPMPQPPVEQGEG